MLTLKQKILLQISQPCTGVSFFFVLLFTFFLAEPAVVIWLAGGQNSDMQDFSKSPTSSQPSAALDSVLCVDPLR